MKSLKCMLETMDRMRDVSGKGGEKKEREKEKKEGKKALHGVVEYNPF